MTSVGGVFYLLFSRLFLGKMPITLCVNKFTSSFEMQSKVMIWRKSPWIKTTHTRTHTNPRTQTQMNYYECRSQIVPYTNACIRIYRKKCDYITSSAVSYKLIYEIRHFDDKITNGFPNDWNQLRNGLNDTFTMKLESLFFSFLLATFSPLYSIFHHFGGPTQQQEHWKLREKERKMLL